MCLYWFTHNKADWSACFDSVEHQQKLQMVKTSMGASWSGKQQLNAARARTQLIMADCVPLRYLYLIVTSYFNLRPC